MTDRQLSQSDLERLLNLGRISRRQFVRSLAALGMTAGGIDLLLGAGTRAAAAQAATPRYLVVIVLDAFRADYLDLQPMPALQALAKAGTSYDRAWVGQLESETPTGHASLATGSMPTHTGVLGFEWRDPTTRREVLDGWPPGVLAGALERDLHRSGTRSIAQAVKAASPSARIVSLSSEKVYAADAMGGYAADYILYHARTGPQHQQLLPSAVPGHVPSKTFFTHPNLQSRLPAQHFTDWDWLSGMLALAAVEEFRPQVLMINLPGCDVYGHEFGGPATPDVMKQVIAGLDRNIERIVAAYQQAGLFEQTLFVVTADHGMVPNARTVGTPTIETVVQQAGGQHYFHTGGTAACIWLHNWWHARAVAEAMLRVPGVSSAYYHVNQHGQYQYLPAPGMSIDPGLDAANQYLLGTFSGPSAPDVVAPYRENTITQLYHQTRGDHGGLNWGAQHIPLVLSGPGVRQGALSHFPARLIDIAPTIVRLLGIPAFSMDGTVLADALADPLASDVAKQAGLAATLTSYQDALITQSVENIAEDHQLGIHPPPPLPARP